MSRLAILIFILSSLNTGKLCARSTSKPYSEVLLEVNSCNIIHQKNMNQHIPPASLTKLMTLFALFNDLNSRKLTPNDRIYFSSKAVRQKPSKLNVKTGDSIMVKEAIYALITKSANDTAFAVGEKLGGNEINFAKLMNYHAKNLNMYNTHFVNASGLHHKQQYTTAYDMCKLAIALLKIFPEKFHYFSKKGFFHKGNYYSSHNKLIGFSRDEFFIDGMKTGFVNASGYNIVASATKGNKRFIVVILGANSARERDRRVSELFKRGFSIPQNINSSDRKRLAFVSYHGKPYNKHLKCKKFKGIKLPKDSILNLVNVSERILARKNRS